MQRLSHRTRIRCDIESNKTAKNSWIRKTTSNNLPKNPTKRVGNVEMTLKASNDTSTTS
jgi:hypothetical protein